MPPRQPAVERIALGLSGGLAFFALLLDHSRGTMLPMRRPKRPGPDFSQLPEELALECLRHVPPTNVRVLGVALTLTTRCGAPAPGPAVKTQLADIKTQAVYLILDASQGGQA